MQDDKSREKKGTMNQLAKGTENSLRLSHSLNLWQFLLHVGLHEHSEPVVHVVGAGRRRGGGRRGAERVAGLHGHVEALQRHRQRLRPEALVELELLGVRAGRREALLLGERRRAPRVALLRHGRRLGHRRRRRPLGRHRRGGGGGLRDGVGRRPPRAAALRHRCGPALLLAAARRRLVRLLLDLVGGLEPLLEVRVPDVLDLVVRPARQPGGDRGPPVTKTNSEIISAPL
ncbi:unnamed protein product [Urochloa decumbens]|uniref:Uncharacterized protein n=1 Tax=Urochloa decumbens TaxID=240449 RepID=A0ABC9C8K7_9POAL